MSRPRSQTSWMGSKPSSTEPRSDTIGPVCRPRRAGPTLDGGLDGDRRARGAEVAGGLQAAALQPRRARGAVGLRLHQRVDRRFPAVHPDPDDRHLRLHLHQHQPDPESAAPVRGSRQLPAPLQRPAHLGLPGRHLPFRRLRDSDRAAAAVLAGAAAEQQVAAGLALLPGALLHAVRDPVRGGALRLERDAQPGGGLDQRRAVGDRHRGARLDQRPGLDLSVAGAHRPVGHRQRHHHQHRGPAERADRAV